ncbi:MAG: hypothetical protein JXA99_12905 [Candidatus Lokiarchaeota archaeon]|nr:hypothetical protein [Candidatus Lokiarchaeota archaeon]
MRWILDACTLIYIVKAELFEQFMNLVSYPVVIDSSVFQEVIIEGKKNNYPDAKKAEKLLNKYKIPTISIDISNDLQLFRDAGETSCYILSKEDGICLTSDDKAFKKFLKERLKVIRLDTFFFEMFVQEQLSEVEFINILKSLEIVSGTTPKSILFFLEKIRQKKENDYND